MDPGSPIHLNYGTCLTSLHDTRIRIAQLRGVGLPVEASKVEILLDLLSPDNEYVKVGAAAKLSDNHYDHRCMQY